MPPAFLRLSPSLQYFGHVIPCGIFLAALSAFQSLPHARSRAIIASRPPVAFGVEVDFGVVGLAVVVAGFAGAPAAGAAAGAAGWAVAGLAVVVAGFAGAPAAGAAAGAPGVAPAGPRAPGT